MAKKPQFAQFKNLGPSAGPSPVTSGGTSGGGRGRKNNPSPKKTTKPTPPATVVTTTTRVPTATTATTVVKKTAVSKTAKKTPTTPPLATTPKGSWWKWLVAIGTIILAGVLVWWFWTPLSKLFDTSAGYVRTPVGAVAKTTNGGLNRITVIGDDEKSPVTIEKSSGDGQQAAVQFGGGGSNTVTIIQAGSYYESPMEPPVSLPTPIPPPITNNIPTVKIWPRDFTPDNTEIVVVGGRHCKLSRIIPPGKDYEFAFPVGWTALMFTSFPDSQYDKAGGNVNINGTCGQVVHGSSLRYRNNGSSDMLVTFVCDQQVRPHRGLIRRIFGCR